MSPCQNHPAFERQAYFGILCALGILRWDFFQTSNGPCAFMRWYDPARDSLFRHVWIGLIPVGNVVGSICSSTPEVSPERVWIRYCFFHPSPTPCSFYVLQFSGTWSASQKNRTWSQDDEKLVFSKYFQNLDGWAWGCMHESSHSFQRGNKKKRKEKKSWAARSFNKCHWQLCW